MSIGGLASYISVLNLPLRRAEIKRRGGKAMAGFVAEVQQRMQADMEQQVGLDGRGDAAVAEEQDGVTRLRRKFGRLHGWENFSCCC